MFTKLKLIGFQAHESKTIKLDKITTIVGPSDVGKSAIVRALRWVTLNKPDGQTFANSNCEKTHVTLFADACKISRLRSKSKNKYILNGKSLVSFGRTQVPDAVRNELNVDAINFQLQHDPPFWFGESAGEVSKQLNTIADLSLMDDSQTRTAKAIRNTKAIADQAAKELEQREKEHSRYRQVRKIQKDFKRLENVSCEATVLELKVNALDQACESAQENLLLWGFNEQRIEILLMKIKAAELEEKCHKLSSLIDQAKESDAILNKIVPDSQIIDSRMAVISQGTRLAALIEQIKQRKAELCDATKTIKGLQQLLPQKCPTCGQAVGLNSNIGQ